MNILEFEVKNQVLKRIDSQDVLSNTKNIYKCCFTFEEDSEWVDLNKFVIFKDGWGNSSTVHLGNSGGVLSCIVPNKVLRGSYFKISIYGGDLVTTNNVSVALIQSGYTKRPNCQPHLHNYHSRPKRPPYINGYCGDKDIFVEIFDRLDYAVDSIVYDEHTLYLFGGDRLLESIYLPFILEDEFEDLVKNLVLRFIKPASEESDGLMTSSDRIKLDNIEEGANRTIVDTELNIESQNPISNNAVVEALNGKEDSYNMVERLDNLIVELINKGD